MNCVRLYLNAFKQDNEPNKADQLHLKFPLWQLHVEACFL
jgi:hypothetical protein